MLLETTIEEFLNKKTKYMGYKKEALWNLLQSDKKYSLLQINDRGELIPEELIESIKRSVQAYNSNKDSAIDIYKRYVEFLKDEYGIFVDIKFPPIPVSITFERIMYIAKYLQDPNHKVSDLEEKLWVDKRTIEKDLRKIRGNTKDPIQVCGKKFEMPEIERSKGKVIMPSTAHPIFLTSNLTQIIVTLKGLKQMSQDSAYTAYAHDMAKSIWAQLSDYAKKRIIYVTENLMPDEVQWYLDLDEDDENSFSSEYMCRSTEGLGCVLDCLKNGKACFIEYKKEDDSIQFYGNCTIDRFNGETITITHSGKKIELLCKNILRSSYTSEELI